MHFQQYITIFYVTATIGILLAKIFLPAGLTTYGKSKSAPKFWIERLVVPKQWFLHFYLVGFVINTIFLMKKGCFHLLLILMEMQMLRRTIESLIQAQSDSKIHLIHYILGLSYYFFTIEALGQSNYSLNPVWILIFFLGTAGQFLCHRILLKIRRTNSYQIPEGFLFEYVSSPHYFCEIIIYWSFAEMGNSFNLWLNVLFVITNLTVTASNSQFWYRREFKGYPLNRKTLIPFLY